jgi:hypothetical protein
MLKLAATEAISKAKIDLSKFMQSPEGKSYTAAVKEYERLEERRDESYSAYLAVKRGIAVKLGIRKSAGPDRIGDYTKAFLKAAAEQIGCTREEAEANLTGLPSYHGSRVDGVELYDQIVALFAETLVDFHPETIAASKAADKATEQARAAREHEQDLAHRYRDQLGVVQYAEAALRKVGREEVEARERSEKREARIAAKPAKDKETIARFDRIKRKMLQLDELHRARSGYGGRQEKEAQPVTWWKGAES